MRRMRRYWLLAFLAIGLSLVWPRVGGAWTEDDFAKRALVAYPVPSGRDNIVGQNISYTLQKGDTLLDVGRWFDVTATEIANANGHLDWWQPPEGKTILLPA